VNRSAMVNLRLVADLEWFYLEAEGDLGMHGQNYDPDRWRGGSPDPDAAAKCRTAAVVRWCEVARRLRVIGHEDERVLRLAYTPHQWRGLERWGRLAGVAAWLYDREDVVDSGVALAMLHGQKGAEVVLKDYEDRAKKRLADAFKKYREA
jgi:hypothetical protein